MTVDLCEHLIENESANQALPLLENVLTVYESRFEKMNSWLFDARLLQGSALFKMGKVHRAKLIFQNLWVQGEGEDPDLLRSRLEEAGFKFGE